MSKSAKKEFLHEKLTQQALYDAQLEYTADMDQQRQEVEDILDLVEDWVRAVILAVGEPESYAATQYAQEARGDLLTRILERL